MKDLGSILKKHDEEGKISDEDIVDAIRLIDSILNQLGRYPAYKLFVSDLFQTQFSYESMAQYRGLDYQKVKSEQ